MKGRKEGSIVALGNHELSYYSSPGIRVATRKGEKWKSSANDIFRVIISTLRTGEVQANNSHFQEISRRKENARSHHEFKLTNLPAKLIQITAQKRESLHGKKGQPSTLSD